MKELFELTMSKIPKKSDLETIQDQLNEIEKKLDRITNYFEWLEDEEEKKDKSFSSDDSQADIDEIINDAKKLETDTLKSISDKMYSDTIECMDMGTSFGKVLVVPSDLPFSRII